MKVLHNNRLILDVDFLVSNNGVLYYQRGIPKDLQHRFGKKLIKVKLNVKDRRRTPAAQAIKLAKSHDILFAGLRGNPDVSISEQRLAALALLDNFQLRQGDGVVIDLLNSDEAIDQEVLDRAGTFLEHYANIEQAGALTEIDRIAYQALRTPLPLFLSDALDLYFANHKKGKDENFTKRVKTRWDKFIEVVGDIPLISLNRDTARRYRDVRLTQSYGKIKLQPVKTATVEREIKAIRAIITKVVREEDLNIRNPFEAINISGLGKDSKERYPFTTKELTKLINFCIKDFDDIRCLIIVQACTGARISEIAGLRLSDLRKHGEIQYLSIREYGQRTVKTKSSIRDVPLPKLALSALLKHQQSLKKVDKTFFPRYSNGDTVSNDAASASVNNYIKSIGIKKTSHSLRHSMRDLLRSANVPIDIAHEIGGWGSQQIADRYGKGHDLKVKLEALESALQGIKLESLDNLALEPKALPASTHKTEEEIAHAMLKRASRKSGSMMGDLSKKLGRKATREDLAKEVKARKAKMIDNT